MKNIVNNNNFSKKYGNKILEFFFNHKVFVPPKYVYVGLLKKSSRNPIKIVEPRNKEYARVKIASSDLTIFGNKTMVNIDDIEFSYAKRNWGLITHFALFDAKKKGDMIYQGRLTIAKDITRGDTGRFRAGDMDINL